MGRRHLDAGGFPGAGAPILGPLAQPQDNRILRSLHTMPQGVDWATLNTWLAAVLGNGTVGQALVVNSPGSFALGNVGGGSGGGLSFVGSATVSGAAATTLTLSGLDLDTDGRYLIFYAFKNATTSTATISLYYNSDTTATNYQRQTADFSGSTPTIQQANDAGVLGLQSTTGGVNGDNNGYFFIANDVSARPRLVNIQSRDGTTGLRVQLVSHYWKTSGANVTGITFSSSVASAFAIGSTAQLWKMAQ